MYDIKNITRKMSNAISYIGHIWEKILDALHYPITWIGGLGLFVIDSLAGGRVIIYMVVIASVIDFVCGISVALKKEEFTLSELMRQTVEKLVIYGLALLVFLCIDSAIEHETGFEISITSGVVGSLITLTEAWSFSASLLILFPNNPLLKLLQKQLTGEISRKLGCDESDVKQILESYRKKKNVKRDSRGRFVKR